MKAKCQICVKNFYTGCGSYSTNIINNKYCFFCSKCIYKEKVYLKKQEVQNQLITKIKIDLIKDKTPKDLLNLISSFLF